MTKRAVGEKRCSFCTREPSEISSFEESATSRICNHCVELFAQRAQVASEPPQVEPERAGLEDLVSFYLDNYTQLKRMRDELVATITGCDEMRAASLTLLVTVTGLMQKLEDAAVLSDPQ